MSQTVYKLRHKPTGLFYQPVSGRWSKDKTHLSTKGKIYESRNYPKPKELLDVFVSEAQIRKLELDFTEKTYNNANKLLCKLDDWEVVEYCLTEKTL